MKRHRIPQHQDNLQQVSSPTYSAASAFMSDADQRALTGSFQAPQHTAPSMASQNSYSQGSELGYPHSPGLGYVASLPRQDMVFGQLQPSSVGGEERGAAHARRRSLSNKLQQFVSGLELTETLEGEYKYSDSCVLKNLQTLKREYKDRINSSVHSRSKLKDI